MASTSSLSYSSEDEENIIPSPTPSPPRKEERTRRAHNKTIAVEGNIGCGKTTFLKYFSQYKNIEVLAEPVDKWKDVMGVNALDLMYKDAKRWSCAFQSLVTLSMLDHHRSTENPSHIKMIERSIYSTRHCFMQNLKESGLIPPMDYEILDACHSWVNANEHIELDLIVYLRASPEVCAKRIKKRNRHEEAGVPMDYLTSLHKLHDDWLLLGKRGALPCPVLVIDANKNNEEMQIEIENLRHDILAGVAPHPTNSFQPSNSSHSSKPPQSENPFTFSKPLSTKNSQPSGASNPGKAAPFGVLKERNTNY